MRWIKRCLIGFTALGLGWVGLFGMSFGTVAQAAEVPYTFSVRGVDEMGQGVPNNQVQGIATTGVGFTVTGDFDIVPGKTTYADVIEQSVGKYEHDLHQNSEDLEVSEHFDNFTMLTLPGFSNRLSGIWTREQEEKAIEAILPPDMDADWAKLITAEAKNKGDVWWEKNVKAVGGGDTTDTTRSLSAILDIDAYNQILHQPVDLTKSGQTLEIPFKAAKSLMIIAYQAAGETFETRPIFGYPGYVVTDPAVISAVLPADAGYVADTNQLVFGPAEQQSVTVTYIPVADAKTVTIHYVMSDGTKAPADRIVRGTDNTVTVTHPLVTGYTASELTTPIDFKSLALDDAAGNSTNPAMTVTYQADKQAPSTGGTTGTTGTAPTPAADEVTSPQPVKIYGKRALYRYSHVDFKKSERIQFYTKKAKAYAPVFTAVKQVKSRAGNLRYELADGTFVTANPAYTAKLYWQGAYQQLFVTHPRGINVYRTDTLKTRVRHLKQGTSLMVKQIVKKNGQTRYQLTDGTYVTGNKRFVSPTQPRVVKQVQTKRSVGLYRDVNLTHKVKGIRRGTHLVVKGWDFSHGERASRDGVMRYRVAGGYVSANRSLVAVIN